MHPRTVAQRSDAARDSRPPYESRRAVGLSRELTLAATSTSLEGGIQDILPMLETRLGPLKLCSAPPRRRRKRGLGRWLSRVWRGEKRGRFDLARDISTLHAGSRWTRNETLSGTTSAFSLPELFGMMSLSEKSGVLGLALGGESVSFHLSRGRLVAGRSDNAPPDQRLGAILVRQGAMNRKALRSMLSRQTPLDGQLGCSLLRHRLVTPEELRSAVHEQYRRLVRRTQEQLDAPFVFQECEVDESPDGLTLDLDALLLEAASERDEESRPNELMARLRGYRSQAMGA